MNEKELQDFIVREVRNYVASAAAKPYVMLDKEVPHIKIPKPIVKSYDNKDGIITMILTCDLEGSSSSKLYRAIFFEEGQLIIEEFGRIYSKFVYPSIDISEKEKTND